MGSYLIHTDLIRWRGLWSGREFHRSLAGRKGVKKMERKIKKIERGKRPGKGGALRVSFFSSLD